MAVDCPGDKLFAGATGAADQHRGGVTRHLGNPLTDPSSPLGLANNRFQRVCSRSKVNDTVTSVRTPWCRRRLTQRVRGAPPHRVTQSHLLVVSPTRTERIKRSRSSSGSAVWSARIFRSCLRTIPGRQPRFAPHSYPTARTIVINGTVGNTVVVRRLLLWHQQPPRFSSLRLPPLKRARQARGDSAGISMNCRSTLSRRRCLVSPDRILFRPLPRRWGYDARTNTILTLSRHLSIGETLRFRENSPEFPFGVYPIRR